MSSEQPIGIFDSGIGGLTVAHEINKLLPNEQIIYFGDTQHLPYGDKSHSKITYYSEKIVDFLLQKKCKAIIIACNSASSVALKHLVKKTQKSCVIFNVIDPLIKAISNDKKIKNIGVIGTNATIYSGVYEQYIYQVRPDIKTYSLATPILASLIEEDNEKLYTSGVIESYLSHKVFNSIDTLILGCTHYPLIESKIKDFYQKKIKIISSLNYIGNHVKDILSNLNLLNKSVETTSKYSFYVSDYTDNFQKKTKIFFPTSIILEEENIFS